MNPRELVDHIRSGPAALVLTKPLRFRRRTRSNPCDFNEFLQALRSSETIRTATCGSHRELGISEDDWVLLVKTLGSIKGIRVLNLYCRAGSLDFHPFQAVADAVKSAQSLCKLIIALDSETFPRDPSGLTALANAIRQHKALRDFRWIDFCPLLGAAQNTALDPLLRALPACPHLRKVAIKTKYASADAMKNLLQLRPTTDLNLALKTYQWLAVADEIRQGRCNVETLTLAMYRGATLDATEAAKAVAGAIRLDRNLEHLNLRMENGFTDEAGVALAGALTVSTTLRIITLSDTAVVSNHNVRSTKATLGAQAYEAFSAMLLVNTSLVLKLPPFKSDGADERLHDSHNQMIIEQRLNQVGRGRLLSSSQTTREEWVDALHELNSCTVNDSPACRVSCLFSLLRLSPDVVGMP
jgi:hypothetical protein